MGRRQKAGIAPDPMPARVFLTAVVLAGATVVAVSLTRLSHDQLRPLSLFAAAGIAAELLYIHADRRAADPTFQYHSIGFAAGVHLAAALVLGPWAAAVTAGFGSLFARPMRQASWRVTRFNSAMTTLAVFGAGFAFQACGGTARELVFPGDWPALLGFFAAFYAINDNLLTAILRLSSGGGKYARILFDVVSNASKAYPAECGLVTAIAILALHSPWAVIALVPLAIAMYQGQSRLATLHRETARALETFASIVDERDESTYRHSERVAELVRTLGRSLELDATAVARLEWTARLHDLGKIAVDASVLRKPGRLDESEWAAMQRHPRLSARILRRFRFAAAEARAVEYHHERFDGHGYFAIAPESIPLASHLLVVVDSYDAMTSDRPYRRALTKDAALAEIEANMGSQFHPTIAKAFVALERGEDPLAVLTAEEHVELQALGRADGGRQGQLVRMLRRRLPEALLVVGAVAALAVAGLGHTFLAAPIVALALAGLGFRAYERRRGATLSAALATAHTIDDVVRALDGAGGLVWVGLVRWFDASPTDTILASWADATEHPDETALASWLVRDTDDGIQVLRTDEAELGQGRVYVAALLAPPNNAPAAYLVLGFAGEPPRWLEGALSDARPGLERWMELRSPAERRAQIVAAS